VKILVSLSAVLVLCFFPAGGAFSNDLGLVDFYNLDGKFDVHFTVDATQLKQRRTEEAAPSTTKSLESTLSFVRRFSPEFLAGMNLSVRNQDQESDDLVPGFDEPASLQRDKYEAEFFGFFRHNNIEISPSIRGGFDSYELVRPDFLTGLTGVSTPNGYHGGVNLEVAMLLPLSQRLFLRPVADIDYSILAVESFTESGAGPNNIAFDSIFDVRTTAQAGLGMGTLIPTGEESWIIPFVQARYRRNFNSDPITTHAALASGILDLGEVVMQISEEPDGLILNTGFFYRHSSKMEIRAAYEGSFFPSSSSHSLSGRLSVSF